VGAFAAGPQRILRAPPSRRVVAGPPSCSSHGRFGGVDGEVARVSGRSSSLGAVLDVVFDR
jgi:hypothetical protein